MSVTTRSTLLVRLGTEMMVARAEFLMRAMKMLPMGWTTVRRAWGRTTVVIDCGNVMPSERAASAWPLATELIPARTASATNVPV